MREPLVQPHKLVIGIVTRIIGIEPRGEGLIALDPGRNRTIQIGCGCRQEIFRWQAAPFASDLERCLYVSEAERVAIGLGLGERPVFEPGRFARCRLEAIPLRHHSEQSELEGVSLFDHLRRRRRAGLVIDDSQRPIGIPVKPVDLSVNSHTVDMHFAPRFDSDNLAIAVTSDFMFDPFESAF